VTNLITPRALFSPTIPFEFGQTGISAIRSAVFRGPAAPAVAGGGRRLARGRKAREC